VGLGDAMKIDEYRNAIAELLRTDTTGKAAQLAAQCVLCVAESECEHGSVVALEQMAGIYDPGHIVEEVE